MATPVPVQEVAFSNSPSIIYSIISGLIGVILFLIWRSMLDLKVDIKELYGLHRTCRDEIKNEFVSLIEFGYIKKDIKDIQDDRKEKWKKFFAHIHNPSGKIEID